MLFRTELQITESENKISHDDRVLLLGSCFSQNIGERLQNYKFKSISNPFGTIFHPIPIARLIEYIVTNKLIHDKELILSQGVYVHPDFHSIMGDVDLTKSKFKINKTISDLHLQLKDMTYLFITLGTAIGYRMKINDQLVANCHKLPQNMFTKEETSLEECVGPLSTAIEKLFDINKNLKIILTISPVRHIKDGMIENMRSKAKLIIMSELLVKMHEHVSYFPAYEMMMDDLRDYRFYEKDLIHPNGLAIDYIWEKFTQHYFEKSTLDIVKQIDKINLALTHRPFNADSENHRAFKVRLDSDIKKIESQYPWIKFDTELLDSNPK